MCDPNFVIHQVNPDWYLFLLILTGRTNPFLLLYKVIVCFGEGVQ